MRQHLERSLAEVRHGGHPMLPPESCLAPIPNSASACSRSTAAHNVLLLSQHSSCCLAPARAPVALRHERRKPRCSPYPLTRAALPFSCCQVNALLGSEREASQRLRAEAARTKGELERALEVSAALEREVGSLRGMVSQRTRGCWPMLCFAGSAAPAGLAGHLGMFFEPGQAGVRAYWCLLMRWRGSTVWGERPDGRGPCAGPDASGWSVVLASNLLLRPLPIEHITPTCRLTRSGSAAGRWRPPLQTWPAGWRQWRQRRRSSRRHCSRCARQTAGPAEPGCRRSRKRSAGWPLFARLGVARQAWRQARMHAGGRQRSQLHKF